MVTIAAAQSGTFTLGGRYRVNRLGYGSMQLTGPGQLDRKSTRLNSSH